MHPYYFDDNTVYLFYTVESIMLGWINAYAKWVKIQKT